MKYINVLVSSCLGLSLTGCITVNHIKPQDVKNLSGPNDVITNKSLNGNNPKGKEYSGSFELRKQEIPYTYLKAFCVSQQGTFKQAYHTDYSYVSNTDPKVGYEHISNVSGGFYCDSKQPWSVSIEPTSTRYNTFDRSMTAITLLTKVIPNSQLEAISRNQNYKNQQVRLNYEREQQIAEQQKITAQNNYNRMLITNAPKHSDIGATICKVTDVSEYTGIVVVGEAQYRLVKNATIVASLESFGNGNNNIKINIKGWLGNDNLISSGKGVLYKQTPLESGKVIWDDQKNWYKCDY